MHAVGEYEKGKKTVWIIARQHPGESMAEWFVEGKTCDYEPRGLMRVLQAH